MIGASGAILDYITFIFLYNALEMSPGIATTISISLGIINNFILNVVINFKTRTHLFKRFISFYTVGLLGILVSIVVIYLMHEALGLSVNLAKLLSIPIIVVMQYTLNKHITFGVSGAKLGKSIKSNLLLILVNMFFVLNIGFMMKHTVNIAAIPTKNIDQETFSKQPPDESTHYTFNTLYILNNHKLPVSGKDDVEALSYCKSESFSQVP